MINIPGTPWFLKGFAAQSARRGARIAPIQPSKPKGMVLNKAIRDQYVDFAVQTAQKYGLPPDVLVAQIQQESGFNPTARGKAGEIGIAQIIPRFHPNVNPHDPYQSIEYLAQYLSQAANMFAKRVGPDLALVAAVASWNAGAPTIASGRIPPITYRYIMNIFGKTVADELVRRLSGLPPSDVNVSVVPVTRLGREATGLNLPPSVIQEQPPFPQYIFRPSQTSNKDITDEVLINVLRMLSRRY